ncbi:putative DNA binding protein [Klebsiella pneumoniae]|nr:putative DNA binding protein [Klebsiella pneumoniae]
MLWDRDTIDATTDILVALRLADTVIAAGIVIATNKIREFNRMQDLDAEELG